MSFIMHNSFQCNHHIALCFLVLHVDDINVFVCLFVSPHTLQNKSRKIYTVYIYVLLIKCMVRKP